MASALAGALVVLAIAAAAPGQDPASTAGDGETVLSPRQIAIDEAETRMRDYRRRGMWREVVLEADRIMSWDAEHGTASIYRRMAVENLQKLGQPVPTPAPATDPSAPGGFPSAGGGAPPFGGQQPFGGAAPSPFGAPAQTPPPFGGQEAPPFGGGQQQPAGPFGGQQQPPFGGGQRPPFGGGQGQPPFGGQQPPPFGGQGQPPFGGQPGNGGGQGGPFGGAPPFGGGQQQPPPFGGGEQTATTVFGGSQPAGGANPFTAGGSPFSTGGSGGEATPQDPFGGGATTPAGGGSQPIDSGGFGGSPAPSSPFGGSPSGDSPFGGSTSGGSPFGGSPPSDPGGFGGSDSSPVVPSATPSAPASSTAPATASSGNSTLTQGLMVGGGILVALALLAGGVKLFQSMGGKKEGGAPKKKAAKKVGKAVGGRAGAAPFTPLKAADDPRQAAARRENQATLDEEPDEEEDVAPTMKARNAPKPADLMAAISENSQLDMIGGASVGADQDLFDPSKLRRAADAAPPSAESDSVNDMKTVVSSERREAGAAAAAAPPPASGDASGSIDLSGLSFGFGDADGGTSPAPSTPSDSAPASLSPRDSAFGTLFGEGAGAPKQAASAAGAMGSTPNFGGLSAFDSSRPMTREGDKIPGFGGMAAAFDPAKESTGGREANPFEETNSPAPSAPSAGGGFGDLFGVAASRGAEASPFGGLDFAETGSAPPAPAPAAAATAGGFGSEFMPSSPAPASPQPPKEEKKTAGNKAGKPQALFDSSFLDFGGVRKKPAEQPAPAGAAPSAPAFPEKGKASHLDDILFSAETMAPQQPGASAPSPAPANPAFELTAHSALFGGLDATGQQPASPAPAAPSPASLGGFADLELTATSNPFGSAFGAPPEAPTAETASPFGSAFGAPIGGHQEPSPFDATIGLSDAPAPPEETTLVTAGKPGRNESLELATTPSETMSDALGATLAVGGPVAGGGMDQRPVGSLLADFSGGANPGAFDATIGLPGVGEPMSARSAGEEPTVSLGGAAKSASASAAAGSPLGAVFQGKQIELDATMAAPLSGESGRVATNKQVEVSARDSFAAATAAAQSEERRKSRSASLLNEQKTLAEKSAEAGDWAKAVHYYAIAQALSPNDAEIKAALTHAREQRKAATGK